jgi:hypothetical protein
MVVEGMGWMAVVVFDLPRVVDLRCVEWGRGCGVETVDFLFSG